MGPCRSAIERKWRPSLALVLGATLAVVLCLPLIGIAALGVLAPRLGQGGAWCWWCWPWVAATALVGWVLARILLRPIRGLADRAPAAQGRRSGGLAADGPLRHRRDAGAGADDP